MLSKKQRQEFYGVAGAAIALLVAYNVITADKAPLWMALVTALLWVSANITQITKATDAGRAAIYAVSVAAAGLLSGYGILGNEQVPLWLGLIAAALGTGTQVLGVRNATDDPGAGPGPGPQTLTFNEVDQGL